MPPGPAKNLLKEMFQVARAMKLSKHKMNNVFLNEKLYHDLMLSLGTGAAEKLDIDITSEFALLPDAPIIVDQSLNDIDDLGHSSHSSTAIPTAAREKPSDQAMSDEAGLFRRQVADLELSRNHDAAEPADEHIEPPVPPWRRKRRLH